MTGCYGQTAGHSSKSSSLLSWEPAKPNLAEGGASWLVRVEATTARNVHWAGERRTIQRGGGTGWAPLGPMGRAGPGFRVHPRHRRLNHPSKPCALSLDLPHVYKVLRQRHRVWVAGYGDGSVCRSAFTFFAVADSNHRPADLPAKFNEKSWFSFQD